MPSQNNFHVPHLCGGILFNLLLETRKTRGKIRDRAHGGTDGLSDLDVYIGLVNVVAGNDWKDVDGTTKNKCVSNYKRCVDSTGSYVPFTDEVFRKAFDSEYNKKSPALLERMARFIEQYLSLEKCKWLGKALIEIMQKDPSINDDAEIAVDFGQNISVKKLHEARNIHFLPFFLSVLHYVIDNCPDCESGRSTFETWYCQVGPKAPWKPKHDVLSKLGGTIGDMEVSVNLEVQKAITIKDAEHRNSESTSSADECSSEKPDKNNDILSPESPLSNRDTTLLPRLAKGFNKILKFAKDTDLSIERMPSEIPNTFDTLYNEWKDQDTDFKDPELNKLKYDILNTLYGYFDFWGTHLWSNDDSDCFVHLKNTYKDSWKKEGELRQQAMKDREAFTRLHERLCRYIIDFDIDLNKTEPVEAKVVKETPPLENNQGGSRTTIIEHQTNIGHSVSKTYNIKDSTVTFND